MTTIAERQSALVERFGEIGDWEERYGEIIRLGRLLPEFPEDQRTELNKVKGCQSQVWMHAALQDGNVVFGGDRARAYRDPPRTLLRSAAAGDPGGAAELHR